MSKIPLLGYQSMPPKQRVGRNDGVERQERFASYGLGLPRKQRPFGIGKADSLSPQPFPEQPVFSLKEFDDDQLMSIDPILRAMPVTPPPCWIRDWDT